METGTIQSPAIGTTRNIWFVSDTHFGHANILKFKHSDGSQLREFDNVEHMDETMVDNWNRVVADNDIVYHLGDVYFGQGHKVLNRLKGRKRLILGNHDTVKNQDIQANFQKILVWRMFTEYGLLLTHIPVHAGSFEMKSLVNVHGHTHKHWVSIINENNQQVDDVRYFNVCVENTNFTPIHIDDVLARIQARKTC